MTDYVSSITVDAVMDALRAYIQPFLPVGAMVIRSQANRVPTPPAPFVSLKELFEVDLNTPYSIFEGEQTTIKASTRIDVQVDFYGEDAGDYCKAVKSSLRTSWGYAQFPANIKPLSTDDGQEMPFVNGESQYERRWLLTIAIQYNPNVTVPQQSALSLTPELHPPIDQE